MDRYFIWYKHVYGDRTIKQLSEELGMKPHTIQAIIHKENFARANRKNKLMLTIEDILRMIFDQANNLDKNNSSIKLWRALKRKYKNRLWGWDECLDERLLCTIIAREMTIEDFLSTRGIGAKSTIIFEQFKLFLDRFALSEVKA